MITGAVYEEGNVYLLHDSGEHTEHPFTPSILLPKHLPIDTQPTRCTRFGCYYSGDMETLVELRDTILPYTDAIIFPEPERQFLLMRGITPFSEGMTISPSSVEEALYAITKTYYVPPETAYVENVLFLKGIPRSLTYRYRLQASYHALFLIVKHNVDESALSNRGILQPISLAVTDEPIQFTSPLGERVLDRGDTAYLGEFLLNNIPHRLTYPVYTSTSPSPLVSSIIRLINVLKSSIRSNNESSYYIMSASFHILSRLPSLLLNTHALGVKGRESALLFYHLYRSRENIYNSFFPHSIPCYQDLNGQGLSLPALFNLLMEHLPL